jgi:3-hydroxyacyl-CoA dehydrogenase/enoyl-CoA hydratase/3-hydroxybutyryl-CoA epimerase
MPLIEIIAGDKTSDETLARAFDQVTQQRKTPIIVNDSPGFFTSRVIGTFINEAVAMVSEGISPVLVERAGEAAGYPAAPLQLMDELTLTLPLKIEGEAIKAAAAAGVEYDRHPGMVLVETMAKELGREGKFAGKGFYDYADGKRTRLWPGLAENFGGEKVIPLQDAIDRMLFAEALETVKCFDEGVLRTFEDANIGSIFGIGFPAWTGGVAQYIDQYEGGTTGFVARCKELADAYGDRFVAPASLIEKADQGEPLRPRR